MIYEIYGIENNLASLMTTVRFRVYEQLPTIKRLVDDCTLRVEGRYEMEDEELAAIVEETYEEEVLNA